MATYYVATAAGGGSDSNPGTLGSPKATLTGASGAFTLVSAGDRIEMRAGTYNEAINDYAIAGVSFANAITIAAYTGETVWLRPTSSATGYVIYLADAQEYLIFDGINLDARAIGGGCLNISGFSGGNAHHIRYQNAEFVSGQNGVLNEGTSANHNCIICTADVGGIVGANEFLNLVLHPGGDAGDFAYGAYLQSDDNLVSGCQIYGASGAGLQIYNGHGFPPDANQILNCIIHDIVRSADNRYWGVIVGNGTNAVLANLLIYGVQGAVGTGSAGIQVYGGSGTDIYNCTVVSNSGEGIAIEPGASSTEVKNCILYGNGSNYRDSGTGTATATNLIGTDPVFVDGPGRNYKLQATSAAVNAGTTLGGVTATDLVGVSRPQSGTYDMGALERDGDDEWEPIATGTPAPSTTTGASLLPCESGTTTPGGAGTETGPILPTVNPTWTPQCVGGGTVASASNPADAEDWAA